METYKIGLKRFSDVLFNGEIWQINNDYWTTVEANSERQAKILAMDNLRVRVAKTEWFTNKNVRYWTSIRIDLSDMVIGE